MNKIGGLGKGLDALFAEIDFNEIQSDEKVVALNVSQIVPNKNQPRYCFDEESLESLSESIKLNGLIQPIVVRGLSDDQFEIIAGERRFRAAKKAGLKTISAVVRNLNERSSTEIALIENLQRENLNPIEEARSFVFLIKKYGLTQDEVAKTVGKSRSAVANLIRLLQLPKEVLEYVESGEMSEGQARALLVLDDELKIKEMALKAMKYNLSVRELEKLCSVRKVKKKKKQLDDSGHIYKEMEASIRSEINRNVKIEVVSGEKGRLSIDFYNRDDLVLVAQVLAKLKC